ncbi:MAG: hypothetical protein ACI83B_003204, partial [Sediminicola sp.]
RVNQKISASATPTTSNTMMVVSLIALISWEKDNLMLF